MKCEHCPQEHPRSAVMVEMKPGKDGAAWWLCAKCWIDGLRTMHNQRPPVASIAVSPEVLSALVKSGWKDTTPPRAYPDKYYPAKEAGDVGAKPGRAAGKRSR